MKFLTKMQRRLQKRFFPTEWDKVIRQWKADRGDQTLRLNYPLNADSVVLDLGGYKGEWAQQIHSRYGCSVHVFEPVRSFAEGIARRFEGNPGIHVYPFGLGAKSRSEQISLSADASSVFQSGSQSESIQLVDIAEWMEQYSIHHVDLMKVNIEGGEYELLERMLSAGLCSRVNDIQVQFHNFTADAETRMMAILKGLESTHRPTYQYNFVWENWKRKAA